MVAELFFNVTNLKGALQDVTDT